MKEIFRIILYIAMLIIARAINVTNVFLYAHSLQANTFGIFCFLQASAALIITISSFNLSTPITVTLAQGSHDKEKLENSILLIVFGLIATVATLIVMISTVFVFPQLGISTNSYVWFALFTASNAVQIISASALVARGKQILSSFSLIFTAGIICAVLSMSGHSIDLGEALRLTALATMAGALLSIAWLMTSGIACNMNFIMLSLRRYTINKGRRIFIYSINSFASMFIVQFALWYLQRQLLISAGASANAVFGLSTQFYNIVIFLPGIFGTLLLRHLSLIRDAKQHARLVWRFGLLVAVICTMGLALFHLLMPLIGTFFPVRYQIDEVSLVLAVSAGALMFIKFPFSVYFQAQTSAWPELVSSLIFAGILMTGMLWPMFNHSVSTTLLLRVIAHLCQFLLVLAAFVVTSRRCRE